jgi:hypothetical protein
MRQYLHAGSVWAQFNNPLRQRQYGTSRPGREEGLERLIFQ